jgi:hypothetical protein
LILKKQEAFLKPQSGFRLKFFERFGKLFFKKVFQGFDLDLTIRSALDRINPRFARVCNGQNIEFP